MTWVHRITVGENGVGECAACGSIQAVKRYDGGRRSPWRCPGSVRDHQRVQTARRLAEARRLRLSFLPAGEIRCAICDAALTMQTAEVDHDHTICNHREAMKPYCVRCVRGILCGTCNTAIGKLREDPALIRRAASYVEAARLRLYS